MSEDNVVPDPPKEEVKPSFPDRISFSSWMLWRKGGCQHRWKLEVVDKLRVDGYGIYLDFGTCIHHAIEHYKTRKDPVTLDDALKMFEEKFRDLHGKNHLKYKQRERDLKLEDFVVAGKRILTDLEKCDVLKNATVVFNEHMLLSPIERTDDLKINFKGFIDMVIKSVDGRGKPILFIVDIKTCSWGWTLEKKTDRDLQAQIFLYKHFLCKEFNLNPKEVRCAFLLLKRSPRKDDIAVEWFPVSAGPVPVQRTLDNLGSDLTEMKHRFETDSFKKNRSACKNEYGDVCPFFNTKHCPGV